jgi:hypothetical protein
VVAVAVCAGTTKKDLPCTTVIGSSERWCYHHDPARAEERSANAARAASAKHSSVGKELREIRGLIWELLGLTIADRLPYKARKELQNVVQLLQCYLRAVELEMRVAEEPLRSDLDVKGVRAQVLERIELLEEQEREKEELLAGVAAVAEEHGLDAGPLKAVLGG